MSRPRRRSLTATEIDTTIRPVSGSDGEFQGTPQEEDERDAHHGGSRPGRGRHARPRTGRLSDSSLRRHRLLLYLAGAAVILSAGLVLGPRLLHATSGSPQPASRTPMPAGSSQLVPGENPVVQAVGGGVATPVTAPPPPVRRPVRVAPQRTR